MIFSWCTIFLFLFLKSSLSWERFVDDFDWKQNHHSYFLPVTCIFIGSEIFEKPQVGWKMVVKIRHRYCFWPSSCVSLASLTDELADGVVSSTLLTKWYFYVVFPLLSLLSLVTLAKLYYSTMITKTNKQTKNYEEAHVYECVSVFIYVSLNRLFRPVST